MWGRAGMLAGSVALGGCALIDAAGAGDDIPGGTAPGQPVCVAPTGPCWRQLQIPTSSFSVSRLAVGDFDGDGHDDLAIGGDNGVRALFLNGAVESATDVIETSVTGTATRQLVAESSLSSPPTLLLANEIGGGNNLRFWRANVGRSFADLGGLGGGAEVRQHYAPIELVGSGALRDLVFHGDAGLQAITNTNAPSDVQFSTGVALTPTPDHVITGDFDEDGDQDVATLKIDEDVRIFSQDASGAFAEGTGLDVDSNLILTRPKPGEIAIAVVDSCLPCDAFPLVRTFDDFASSATFSYTGDRFLPARGVVADLDGDASQDIILTNGAGPPDVLVVHGDGTGFGAFLELLAGGPTGADVAVGKFNAHPNLDFAVAFPEGAVALFLSEDP